MTAILIAEPATEPVNISELKDYLRIETADEDALIAELLKYARIYLENTSGLKLITQIWRIYLDKIVAGIPVELPLSPIRSVQSVTAYDEDGTPSTIEPSKYSTDLLSSVPKILFHNSLPATRCFNGVEIDVNAGFGDLATDVPDSLRRAIIILAAHWYEFRSEFSPQQQPVSIPDGFTTLLAPYRRIMI